MIAIFLYFALFLLDGRPIYSNYNPNTEIRVYSLEVQREFHRTCSNLAQVVEAVLASLTGLLDWQTLWLLAC